MAVPPERKIPAKAGIFVFCAQVNADLLTLCHQKIFRGGKEGRTSHCRGEAQQVIEMAALPLYMLAIMALKCNGVRQQEMK